MRIGDADVVSVSMRNGQTVISPLSPCLMSEDFTGCEEPNSLAPRSARRAMRDTRFSPAFIHRSTHQPSSSGSGSRMDLPTMAPFIIPVGSP